MKRTESANLDREQAAIYCEAALWAVVSHSLFAEITSWQEMSHV